MGVPKGGPLPRQVGQEDQALGTGPGLRRQIIKRSVGQPFHAQEFPGPGNGLAGGGDNPRKVPQGLDGVAVAHKPAVHDLFAGTEVYPLGTAGTAADLPRRDYAGSQDGHKKIRPPGEYLEPGGKAETGSQGVVDGPDKFPGGGKGGKFGAFQVQSFQHFPVPVPAFKAPGGDNGTGLPGEGKGQILRGKEEVPGFSVEFGLPVF